ncbi:MAG: hypothetical protein JWM33_3200 [Caulobacteraceae bacterium]|nr:hypothetical protein [Caulobacteraceae bacterium]
MPPCYCLVFYHLNPLTCGVAKYNSMLDAQLNIPVVPVFDERLNAFQNPLLSIKGSEFSDHDLTRLQRVVRELPQAATPWFFLHGFENSLTEIDILRRAAGVYCGSRKIFADVSPLVAHTRLLWSPSTIRARPGVAPQGDIRLFSFGMAHKLRASHYLRLKDLLDAAGASYSLSMSTALHEGTSFEDAFTAAFDQLHAVFGEHVRFQGFLSDDAVLDQLKAASFFTAFFEQGVRDNNSSVVAAMEQGTVVITNLDAWSPAYMRHGETVLDINQLDALPTDPAALAAIAAAAREAVRGLSWERLIEGMAD